MVGPSPLPSYADAKAAYKDSCDDLDKLVRWARDLESSTLTKDGVTIDEQADPVMRATVITAALIVDRSWDQLMLACVLGAAVGRLTGAGSAHSPSGTPCAGPASPGTFHYGPHPDCPECGMELNAPGRESP